MVTQTQPGNKHTIQNILNWSFDSDYNLLAVGLIGYDGSVMRRIKVDSSGNLIQKIQETAPTDSTKFNSSNLISYNAAGEAVYVDETYGGVTYRTTLTRSDMVVTSTLPISAAVQL